MSMAIVRGRWSLNTEVIDGKEVSVSRQVTVYLKGPWAPKNVNVDKGWVRTQEKTYIILQDNDYGLNQRQYQMADIGRIDEGDTCR